MSTQARVERGSFGAMLLCMAASGCTPPEVAPALLTIVDPALVVVEDSDILPDSTRAAIRSYMSRIQDSVWLDVDQPGMARIVGDSAGMTASLNREALPLTGRTVAVLIDIPDLGYRAFEVTHVMDGSHASTYTGQTKDGTISILLVEDSVVAGRITTVDAVFNLRSGPYGLIHVAPADRSGSVPESHLITGTARDVADGQDAAASHASCHAQGG